MDILQLRTIIHVAELGSLRKAADRLHIAQPALSRRISMLEQELGFHLFERNGRGMVITRQGRKVLEHAGRIMDELQQMTSIGHSERTDLAGSVKLGVIPAYSDVIKPLMERLKDQPKISLQVSSGYSGYLLEWLQQGTCDIVVMADPPSLESLVITELHFASILVVGPAAKGYSETRPIEFRQLAENALVLPSERHTLRAVIEIAATKAGVTLRTVAEADSFDTMMNFVETNVGSIIVGKRMKERYASHEALQAATTTNPTLLGRLTLVHSADRPLSAAAHHVHQVVSTIMSVPPAGPPPKTSTQ